MSHTNSMQALRACFQVQKILAVTAVLTVLACSDGTAKPSLQPNLVDALELPRSSEQAGVASLVADADTYYRLYSQSGGETYYERHWSAAEGARLLLQDQANEQDAVDQPAWDLEDLFDMPTEAAADDLPDMPFGRA